MSPRLIGVQIANGYSPEARVFAALLAHQQENALEAQVLYHQWPGDTESLVRFREASHAEVIPMDFGWRSVSRDRKISEKIRARLQFQAALPAAAAAARKAAPDIIYSCQQLWDCQAATYIARKLGKPQVIHLHYIIGPWLHKPILERLLTCAHVVTVSDFIRDEALRHGVDPNRVTTIRNGIEVMPPAAPTIRGKVRSDLGIAPDAPLFGIIARLDPDKGQHDTLHAFAAMRQKYPAARLLVVGDETPWHPGYMELLKREASVLGLGESVLFLGRRSDVPHLLAAVDIFVHPSRQDPCPLALLEASAAALPVVAYAEGGAKEIIEDGVTGLLAPSGNTEALASHMTALVDNQLMARQMGVDGRSRMEQKFQPRDASEKLQSLCSSIR